MRAARAIGLAGVADALRERVQVCCVSLGLLLAAAACPHVAPPGSARHLQAALVAVAYPLVGVMLTQLLLISLSVLTINYCSNGRVVNGLEIR